MTRPQSREPGRWTRLLQERPRLLGAWCLVAAFGTYACMYGFRKPFTAAPFEAAPFGAGMKALFVLSQVMGYTTSKWLGIRVIGEMPPERRVGTLLGLVAVAEGALILFGFLPPPYGCLPMFINGLSLGMVFGLVLGFLEGRRMTEMFVAGVCASFIVADGATKSAGAFLLEMGVPERWMPSACGMLFLLPLLWFVGMLRNIPAPSDADVAARSERPALSRGERRLFLIRYAPGLGAITIAYVVVTILRSVRADFAPELWAGLGSPGPPAVFTTSELWVAAGVLGINGLTVTLRDNRRALLSAITVSCLGLLLVVLVIAAQGVGQISAFPFMVLLGLGLYLPYVAVHTTLFERLIAMTRERANVGHLMYVADTAGYLGYLGVMVGRWTMSDGDPGISGILNLGAGCALFGLLAMLLAALWLSRLCRRNPSHPPTPALG
ncbi:MAG: hypothetical protein JNL10_13860 [Verrucomicrobiales bacterium]|nr:hypothetical protein [Verrucomicrobiales bacterium]